MYNITCYYKSKTNSHLEISLPPSFKNIGRGLDLSSNIRDFQIIGPSSNFISILIQFLNLKVSENSIEPEYEINISHEL